MIQLDYETLAIVISIVGIIAALVMLVLWRIDNFEKGLGTWACAACVGAAGFFVLLFNPILGSNATFLNNICTLTAPLLILEGILQFREYGSESFRKRAVPILIIFFIIISYINSDNITRRYIFHDAIVAILFASCAYFLIHGVQGRERGICRITIGSFMFISFGFLYRWILALKGIFNDPIGLNHPFLGVLFLIIALWAIGWTYGLTLVINFRSQQRIMKMATEDDLTGLANRKNLNQTMENIVTQSKESDERYFVFMLDLNGFKMINDTYGHAFGDQVLIVMARAFEEVVRNKDFSARLGGDEFICIVKANEHERDIDLIKKRLRTAVERQHSINGMEVQLRTSIGYSIIPDDGTSVDRLLDIADQRMYEEKISNRPMSRIKK